MKWHERALNGMIWHENEILRHFEMKKFKMAEISAW